MTKHHKKIIISFILFSCFFIILNLIFLDLKVNLYPDSLSYQFFSNNNVPISFYQRPALYPTLLFLLKVFSANLVLSHLVLAGLAVTLIAIISFQTTKNPYLTTLITIVSLLNFNLLVYVKFIAPEILLFLLMLLQFFLFINLKHSKTKIIWLAISSLALTLTKPIFLYWPLILGLILFFKYRRKNKKAVFYSFIFLYLIPILTFSTTNFIQTGNFSYSQIKNANLIGKVLQYQLKPKFELSSSLQKTEALYLDEINKSNPESWILPDPWNLIEEKHCKWGQCSEINRYAQLAILSNPLKYLSKSAVELGNLLRKKPNYSNFQHILLTNKMKSNISDWYQASFRLIFGYKKRLHPVFWIISILVPTELLLTFKKSHNKKIKNSDWNYLYLFAFVFYYYAILGLSAYSAYDRLLGPIYPFLWLLYGWSFQKIITRLIKLIKS